MASDKGSLIVSHSGLRGRPGAGLDGSVVDRLVGGLLALLTERELPHTIAVARDSRPSGEELTAQAMRAAMQSGAEVIDLGTVATPTAKLAARRLGLGGAIIITGSHLGPDWNGLKLVAGPDYWPIDPRRLPPAAADGDPGRGSRTRDRGADELHAASVCQSVDADAIRAAGLRVRLNGSCGEATSLALADLGCTLVEEGADVGLVMDEDGDRLSLIDERSNAIDSEATLPLAAMSLGARRLVKGADTSRIVEVMAERTGWAVAVSSPGELHLLERLSETGADLAGEGNGGVVVPQVGMARDALAAAAAILELLSAGDEPISALAADLPRLVRHRESLPCAAGSAAEALSAMAERVGDAVGDPVEGFTVERPGGGWALVRQSATEPVLRITVESPDERLTDELYDEVRSALASKV
jgi:phosphomannomutase